MENYIITISTFTEWQMISTKKLAKAKKKFFALAEMLSEEHDYLAIFEQLKKLKLDDKKERSDIINIVKTFGIERIKKISH